MPLVPEKLQGNIVERVHGELGMMHDDIREIHPWTMKSSICSTVASNVSSRRRDCSRSGLRWWRRIDGEVLRGPETSRALPHILSEYVVAQLVVEIRNIRILRHCASETLEGK